MLHKKVAPILSVTLFLAILAGCGGAVDVQTSGTGATDSQTSGAGATDSQTSGAVSTPAQLLSISITPSDSQLAQNTIQRYTATGVYSDNTTQDLTDSVTWSTADTTVLVIAESAVRAIEMGTQSTMLAQSSGGGGHGYAYGKKSGTTTVTATSGSATGSTTLTVTTATLVSLAITPTNPSIANGTAEQFTATGTFSDNTTQDMTLSVIWSSSNTAVAQISNTLGLNGLATGVGAGTTTITSTSGGVSVTATLTVATTGSATLAWNAPTTNTDGTPLTDLAGYKIHYGTSPGNYTSVIDVGNVTTYTVANLSSGAYYFTVTSYDSSNIESTYSNEASKIIQ